MSSNGNGNGSQHQDSMNNYMEPFGVEGLDEITLGRRIGRILFMYRCSEGLSREEAAKKLGIDEFQLLLLERGKYAMSADLLESVSKLFDLDPMTLVELGSRTEEDPLDRLRELGKFFETEEE